MKIEEVRIGMKVRANKDSNERYNFTTEEYGCIGKVVSIHANSNMMKIVITDSKNDYQLGQRFDVEPEYFEPAISEKEEPETKESLLLECIKGTTGFDAFKFDDISALDTMIDALEKAREDKKEELSDLAIESAVAFTEVEFANRQGMATDDLRTKAILIQLNMAHTKVTISDIEEQIKNLKKLKEIVTE